MNKVIAAFDGLNVSESTMDYAIYLSKEYNAHIVAAFLEDILYQDKIDNELWQLNDNDLPGIEALTKKEEQTRIESVKKVQSQLNGQGVRYSVHKDKLIAIQSLIRESHFADMILIDANERFSDCDRSKPSHFIKDLLVDSDCPLMIVPKEFKPFEKVVFAYDGSPSSTYAIRLFTYLFPLMSVQELQILMVSDNQNSNHLPEYHLLKELLKRKYPVILQTVIKSLYTADAICDHLQSETKSCVVVLGAYQRNSFSRWLEKSIADTLISKLDIPLFVAHK